MTEYLFHSRVDLVGDGSELVPLDDLRGIDEEAWARAIAKYDDTAARRRLRDTVIPLLDRRWTNVVFLSPIHPHAIWQAWRDITGKEEVAAEFWAIPAGSLSEKPAVIFDRVAGQSGDAIVAADVELFDAARYGMALETTAANKQWLASLAARGRRGAWFNKTPHVLVGGSVSLDDATVIDWRDSVSGRIVHTWRWRGPGNYSVTIA